MRYQARRKARTAVLAAVLGGAVLGTVPAASASASARAESVTSGPSDQAMAKMRAQVPLVKAASAIKAAVPDTTAGYTGIGLVGDHVTLWWKGGLPAKVATAVTAARNIAPVEVAPAAYSKAALKRAARTIRDNIDKSRSAAPYEVKIATDGSGLEVSVDASAASVPSVPKVGVPTKVVRERWLKPTSRDDDTSPWRGGTIMWSQGAGCTSGFGVRDGSGATYLLTAAHCGDVGGQWADADGEPIGPMVQRRPDHDIALISTPQPGNTIYAGGISDERQLVVSGWTEVFPGQLLCQSGRTMASVIGGPRCNLEVQFAYPEGPDQNLVEATQLDGEESAYSGDSGGSVYALGPDGTILAAGTTTRSLGPGFGFQDFATAKADFGITPLTGTTGPCRVSYDVTDSWGGGFTANVTIHNDGPAIRNWTLGWGFSGPGDQEINGTWEAYFSQQGQQVTARNAEDNPVLSAGGSVSFGFNASGPATTPGLFTLNGAYCK